jgi:hypothetical protein
MIELSITEVLDRIEAQVAVAASALHGTSKLVSKNDDSDIGFVFQIHANNLGRIITDLELFYRPALGLDEEEKIGEIKTECDSILADESHSAGEPQNMGEPSHEIA